jgi:DNA-binding MarR family transcriptional regulator
MRKYELLQDIISYLEDFEEDNENGNTKEFAIFLKDKIFRGEQPKSSAKKAFNYQHGMNYRDIPEVEFSTLVGTMYRFARHYIKKALENSNIRTLDEFGFLATLVESGHLNKSELIQKHIMEISSGSEILKRLIKKGLINQVEDPNDKRGKLVTLSPLGQKEIYQAFNEMYKVAQIVKGELTQQELVEMNFMLNKLKYFHEHIHETDRQSNIDALLNKYVTI